MAVIVKQMALTVPQKSSFARLAAYLTDPQEKNERVGTVSLTNCISDQVELATLEIRNTQAQNTRSNADKTYHLMVSFRAGEQPDDATLKAIEERICNVLGFAEHQRMSVLHRDTDNMHIHIAINKIHPARYTIHEPFNAYHKLGQLCEKLEHDHGLERDNHIPDKTRGENRADDMERHSDMESLLGWVKRECKVRMLGAQSWTALHDILRQNGLHIHERANGLVVTADNGISVKASSVGREFSKAQLEQRLGSFQASPELASTRSIGRYQKKPLASKVDTAELYERYRSSQAAASAARAAEWTRAKVRKNRLIEAAKRHGRLKRAAIKLVSAPGIAKKLMYSATSRALVAEIEHINKLYLTQRQEIYARYRRGTWADWLREQATRGDQDALAALRGRLAATGLKGDNLAGGGGGDRRAACHLKHDGVTKKGTIIYRVGTGAVRDDGDKLEVSRGTDQAGLQAALRLAIERYGSRIAVNGSASFQEQIARAAAAADVPVTFTEDALERRRQALKKSTTTKENSDGNDNSRPRPDRGGDGAARRAAGAARTRAAGTGGPSHEHAFGYQPDVETVSGDPSPAAPDRVRGVSELGLVQQPDGGQVLLPGDVPGHVEHQGAEPDHRLRRHPHRPGLGAPPAANSGKPNIGRVGTAPPPASKDRLRHLSQLGAITFRDVPAAPTSVGPLCVARAPMDARANRAADGGFGAQAVDQYISEREQERLTLFDIPKFARYTADKERTVPYAGLRHIDGQALALLRQDDVVLVLAVDDASARRLERIALGTQIRVSDKGIITMKGRSR